MKSARTGLLSGLADVVYGVSTAAATVLFLPGYLLRTGIPIVVGQARGVPIRAYREPTPGAETSIYSADGIQPDWASLVVTCFAIEVMIGAVLLTPLAMRSGGDITYLIPPQARTLSLLRGFDNNYFLLGQFFSRFNRADFWRYWVGASSLVASIPEPRVRSRARISVNRSPGRRIAARAFLAFTRVVTILDEPLGRIGLTSFLVSGVLLGAGVIGLEVLLLG